MSYSPLITPEDLITHIYPEVLAEITRNDDGTIARAGIDAAIQEAKVYLSKYDLVKMFGDQALDAAPVFTDAHLTNMIKVMAIWQLICLSNVTIDYEVFRNRYKDTIRSLERIQEGKSNPLWPYLDTTGLTTPEGVAVKIYTNEKRNNGY